MSSRCNIFIAPLSQVLTAHKDTRRDSHGRNSSVLQSHSAICVVHSLFLVPTINVPLAQVLTARKNTRQNSYGRSSSAGSSSSAAPRLAPPPGSVPVSAMPASPRGTPNSQPAAPAQPAAPSYLDILSELQTVRTSQNLQRLEPCCTRCSLRCAAPTNKFNCALHSSYRANFTGLKAAREAISKLPCHC